MREFACINHTEAFCHVNTSLGHQIMSNRHQVTNSLFVKRETAMLSSVKVLQTLSKETGLFPGDGIS